MSTLSPDQWQALSPYLDQAIAMTDNERSAWLSSLAEWNPALAAQVTALLDEHRILAQEGFLEKSSSALPSAAGLAGQTIGPYTLISQIGEGGMGSVWLADRVEPNVVAIEGSARCAYPTSKPATPRQDRFHSEGAPEPTKRSDFRRRGPVCPWPCKSPRVWPGKVPAGGHVEVLTPR